MTMISPRILAHLLECAMVVLTGWLASANAAPRDVLKYDKGCIALPEGWKDPGTGPIPGSNWAEYNFEVPADGWYGLYFQEMPNLAREVLVDGKRVSLSFGESTKSTGELQGVGLKQMTQGGWAKEVNLPLGAGHHTLRIQRVGRMGFPPGMPRAWDIRPAGTDAADRIQAAVAGPRELRKGEALNLAVRAGAGPAAQYEIFSVDEQTGKSRFVTNIAFPASKGFLQNTVKIPADAEGVFQLRAKAEGRLLTPAEFIAGSYFVVDTQHREAADGKDAPMKLVYDVDCVANTINGKPVEPGKNYWEANGATRISKTPAGVYRESNDGRGPDVNPHPKAVAENFSGFGYLFDVPEPRKAYVIEIEHPDDDWRSVCVSIVDVFDRVKKDGYLPPSFAYETGGYLPLSNRMLTEKVMFWPNGKQMHIGLVSARIGKRAAAARLRIYEVEADLLPSQAKGCEGRFIGLYMEEMKRWHTHFNTPKDLPPAVRDYVGLKRTMEWASYVGMNAFWPTAAAYQEATYDSKELGGYLLQYYNVPRLSVLLCEKYGLGYVAEIFLARQRYFNEKVMTEGVEHPEDLYTTSWWGYRAGDHVFNAGIMPTWNVLHPRVQEKMIAIYGELADSLGDSKAFLGMSGRLDSWNWNGFYTFSSLNWGYEDWTVGQFEKDTGICIPGDKDDPQRFEKRYRFLTSDEMKPRWIAWREARVTDYLVRLSNRIRHVKKDAMLFLCGNARTDESHEPSIPDGMEERLAEVGVDHAVLAKVPGVVLLPSSGYGRGKTRTYLADQKAYDLFADVEFVGAGRNRVRGYGEFGSYQEWGAEFPLDKLGIPLKHWHYCSSSDAAGENALERLAVVLAEQDTMAIRDGGYPLIFGRRDFYSKWMADYTQLPRVPFEPVPFARDPVAVWQHHEGNGFFFYAVNREQYPVTILLKLGGAPAVTRLGNGERVEVKGGVLTLQLPPYGLQAFRAAKSASLEAATTDVPAKAVEFVRERLAFAQEKAVQMSSGVFAGNIESKAADEFRQRLSEAWSAFQKGCYWRVRTLLSSAPMMAVYEKLGEYPLLQVRTRFPNILEDLPTDRFEPEEPFADAAALFRAADPHTQAVLVDSKTFNPQWCFTKVVQSAGKGLAFDLEVPVTADYEIQLGYVTEKPGVMMAILNNQSVPVPLVADGGGEPQKVVFPKMRLAAGHALLSIPTPDRVGVYALKLKPVLRPLPTTLWSVAAPFESFWNSHLRQEAADAALKQGMEKVYPPQKNPALDAVYRNEKGREIRWTQTSSIVGTHEEAGVNFAQRAGLTAKGFGFAQTSINSPCERDVLIYIGSDWWANAYLNGVLLKPDGDRREQEKTGVWFTRWKPRSVLAHLKKGDNTLLVKNQGGGMNCWFTCYITDPGDMIIGARPGAQ